MAPAKKKKSKSKKSKRKKKLRIRNLVNSLANIEAWIATVRECLESLEQDMEIDSVPKDIDLDKPYPVSTYCPPA